MICKEKLFAMFFQNKSGGTKAPPYGYKKNHFAEFEGLFCRAGVYSRRKGQIFSMPNGRMLSSPTKVTSTRKPVGTGVLDCP